MTTEKSDQWTADEALDRARPRDDVRTVELVLVPGQIRVRLALHEINHTAVFSQQRYHEESGQWVGKTLWARDWQTLYNKVLNTEEQDLLDVRGWKPVYFSFN